MALPALDSEAMVDTSAIAARNEVVKVVRAACRGRFERRGDWQRRLHNLKQWSCRSLVKVGRKARQLDMPSLPLPFRGIQIVSHVTKKFHFHGVNFGH